MEVGGTVCSKAKEENLLGKKSVLKLEPFVYQHFSLEKNLKDILIDIVTLVVYLETGCISKRTTTPRLPLRSGEYSAGSSNSGGMKTW